MSPLNPTSALETLHPSNSHSTRRAFWSVFSLLLVVIYSAAVWSQQSDPPTDYKALSIQELTGLAEQGDANAQNQLGITYETGRGTSQDPQQAAAWYQKAAEQGYAAAQSNYGVCLIRGTGLDRDVRQGIEWLRKSAAQRDPNGLRNLGYALEQGWLGKKKISEETEKQKSELGKYMPVCDAKPRSKETCKRADRLFREGEYDEAIRLYNQAIQLDRSHVCAYTGIGWAEGMRGEKQIGMDQMNRTVDMFPDNARARIERGRYALTINRVDLASKDFDQAIKQSYCARAYELRAYCFLEHGRNQSALNYLDMAIKIYPTSAEAYRLRARAHRELGHQEQAAADDAKAATLDRNS